MAENQSNGRLEREVGKYLTRANLFKKVVLESSDPLKTMRSLMSAITSSGEVRVSALKAGTTTEHFIDTLIKAYGETDA